jgi:hypothetical protein
MEMIIGTATAVTSHTTNNVPVKSLTEVTQLDEAPLPPTRLIKKITGNIYELTGATLSLNCLN